MTISQKIQSPICNEDTRWDTKILCWRRVHLPLFVVGAEKVAKRYHSCWGNGHVCHHCSWRSMSTRAWGVRLVCNHHGTHDGCCSSCCLSKSKSGKKSVKEILSKSDCLFLTRCMHLTKRTGHCAWPCCSFSWSDCACGHPSSHRTCCSYSPHIATKMIVMLIILTMIVGLVVVMIVLVALMIVAVLVAMILPVAGFTAACNGKMSRLLLFWLLLILGNLLKNAGCFVGCLTLLKKSNELKRVRRHCLVCICNAPWAAQRRLVCSSLALFATPSFDGGSHHQGSWQAVLDAA